MNEKKLFTVSAPILLCGETGTGKSRLAKLIHDQSPWSHKKFLTVHLSSLSEALLESELFGHLRGSFTGAVNDKKGYCESVEDGTLFLDEIGELSLEAQKKLLYLLEEKRFTPLGSCQSKIFRGRIIAATNKDLQLLISQGKFREDLFFRLRVFAHTLKPLREEPESILSLAKIFLNEFSSTQGKQLSLNEKSIQLLLNYPWPGNIRELKNAMEYSSYSIGPQIGLSELPSWLLENSPSAKTEITPQEYPLDYHAALEVFEKSYFRYIAHHFQGKINHTARELNMSKSTLISKFRKYGVNIWQIRAELKEKEFELRVA